MADEENVEQEASTEAEAPEEETTTEAPAEEAAAEAEAEAPADEPEAEQAEAQAAEAEPAADEPSAEASDEPAAEATTEEVGAEVSTDEAAAAEAPADEPEAPAAPEETRKKKRLPRALRPARSKPKREQPAERKPIVRLEKPEHVRGRRQERQGVVSSASDKTIVVRVDVVKIHPRYKKVIRRSAKFHAHDETNEAKVGDVVRIVETRPLSRLKRWRLQEIVRAAK